MKRKLLHEQMLSPSHPPSPSSTPPGPLEKLCFCASLSRSQWPQWPGSRGQKEGGGEREREKEKEGGEEGKGDGLSFCYTVQATIHLSRHS